MKYVLLIYDVEAEWGKFSEYESVARDPAVRGGAQLQTADTATVVRVQDGDTLTTDGPFAETKEQLGGYYLIEADSLDEAIEWAAKVPAAREGSVEVRPVMVFEEARE